MAQLTEYYVPGNQRGISDSPESLSEIDFLQRRISNLQIIERL